MEIPVLELTRPVVLSSYTVGLGLHSLEAKEEPGSRMIEASLSIQHPDYNNPILANDLMLIKLNESVPESNTIRSIGIASQCPTTGDTCLVSGWGLMGNGELVDAWLPSQRGSPVQSRYPLTWSSVSQASYPTCSSV
jgi:hypothetical protein